MHNERCPQCKDTVEKMLRAIFGEVHRNYRIELGTVPDDYASLPLYPVIVDIHRALQQCRGHADFVKARYVDADFFVPDPGFIVEFDESQHFTGPRKTALERYPADKVTGFDRDRWLVLCDSLHAHDNDPAYRDEQRAWYDTMRDFIPEIKGFQLTVRLYASEMEWCRLDPAKKEDVDKFREILIRTGSKIDVMDDTNFPNNQIPANPVLDLIIRYEYLSNIIKLQYLLDCTTGMFNYGSPYLTNLKEKTKVLNSEGGEAFKVYLNRYFRNKDYLGPLFSDRDPWKYESVAELGTANDSLKNCFSSSDDWFALFCEYTLIKTSLHELTADVHEPENIDKYGYPDLMNLREIEKKSIISGAILRNFVVNCLNIGINPSEDHESAEQEVDHLAGCKYAEFQSRREEWIKLAWHFINRIKAKMNAQNLSSVMQWHKYALCAYDTGPVFIRKKRDFLLHRIARSFETYQKWDQTQLRNNMYEIVGQDVTFVTENYSDRFTGKQTVDFLEGNSDLTIKIKKSGELLNQLYRKIISHIDLTESAGPTSSGISLITIPQLKNLQEPESRIKQIDKKQPKPALHERAIDKTTPVAKAFECKMMLFPSLKRREFSNRQNPKQFRYYYPAWEKTDNRPNNSIYYEINDWNRYGKNEIRIDIQFWNEEFHEIGEIVRQKKDHIGGKMPRQPVIEWYIDKKNPQWSRLQYIFPDTTDPELVAQSMWILINETKEIVNDWLISKNMRHY